jgi:hypothetical protein
MSGKHRCKERLTGEECLKVTSRVVTQVWSGFHRYNAKMWRHCPWIKKSTLGSFPKASRPAPAILPAPFPLRLYMMAPSFPWASRTSEIYGRRKKRVQENPVSFGYRKSPIVFELSGQKRNGKKGSWDRNWLFLSVSSLSCLNFVPFTGLRHSAHRTKPWPIKPSEHDHWVIRWAYGAICLFFFFVPNGVNVASGHAQHAFGHLLLLLHFLYTCSFLFTSRS